MPMEDGINTEYFDAGSYDVDIGSDSWIDFDDDTWDFGSSDDDGWDWTSDDDYFSVEDTYGGDSDKYDLQDTYFDSYLLDEKYDEPPYTFETEEDDSGLKGLLGNKNVWGAIGGLAKEGFGMWQKQQSQERADQLRADANAEWERRERITASLRKSGGGGGKAPTIAAKTTGADREGDFTKRT